MSNRQYNSLNVSYNNKMPHYMREISIVLEYYITLNKILDQE